MPQCGEGAALVGRPQSGRNCCRKLRPSHRSAFFWRSSKHTTSAVLLRRGLGFSTNRNVPKKEGPHPEAASNRQYIIFTGCETMYKVLNDCKYLGNVYVICSGIGFEWKQAAADPRHVSNLQVLVSFSSFASTCLLNILLAARWARRRPYDTHR